MGLLVSIEHRLNTTVYLSIVADHVHPFMTTVYHLLMYFQQDNASCHKDQIISDWFLEHDNEFLLKWPPQSPDLNPIEHLWDEVEREIHIMDVQTTNLQQLCDAIMTIWTKISEECFQHLVESMPRRIKTVLKAKGVQPGTSKVYLIKWPVSVHDKANLRWMVYWLISFPFHFHLACKAAFVSAVLLCVHQYWGSYFYRSKRGT